jgi:hypothetical protein
MTDLDMLRAEHAQYGIGAELSALLGRVAKATAPTYPAAEYSPSGSWDEASLQDALQDWILTRLLERGDLSLLLASARTLAGLRALLTRSFGQHLTNRRRRTSATNLFTRTVRLLRGDDGFVLAAPSAAVGDEGWALRDREQSAPATSESVAALVKAAGMRSDTDLGIVRYGPYSLKSSPVLREPQLREFVRFLLGHADGYVTLTQLFHVMRHRFNLIEPAPIELDEATILELGDVAGMVEARLLARSVVARLGADQTRLLRALADADGDAKVAAARAGANVAQFTEALDATYALIAEYADTPEDAVAVYRRVVESLYLETERP